MRIKEVKVPAFIEGMKGWLVEDLTMSIICDTTDNSYSIRTNNPPKMKFISKEEYELLLKIFDVIED